MRSFITGPVLLSIVFGACGDSQLPTSPASGTDALPGETDVLGKTTLTPPPGLALVDAALTIDQTLVNPSISIVDSDARILFIFLKDRGLFTISAFETSPAQVAGSFNGSEVAIELDGTTIQIVNASDPLVGDGSKYPAWVIRFADFPMFAAGVDPADLAIGLVTEPRQIPGWDRQ